MAAKKPQKSFLSDAERLAPDEIYDEDGQLLASKLESCVLTKCDFNTRDGRMARIKIKANTCILKQLNLLNKVRSDSRKGNKDIFICYGHFHIKHLPTATALKQFLETKLIPANIKLNSKNAKVCNASVYWRKKDIARLKCSKTSAEIRSLALQDHDYLASSASAASMMAPTETRVPSDDEMEVQQQQQPGNQLF